jgi:hypothetical protein
MKTTSVERKSIPPSPLFMHQPRIITSFMTWSYFRFTPCVNLSSPETNISAEATTSDAGTNIVSLSKHSKTDATGQASTNQDLVMAEDAEWEALKKEIAEIKRLYNHPKNTYVRELSKNMVDFFVESIRVKNIANVVKFPIFWWESDYFILATITLYRKGVQ